MTFIFIRNLLTRLFGRGHERSVKAKRQILYSFGLKGISIVIGLFLVPLLLDYLDAERYGIWLTLSSLLGWFSFFDIGLGNGLRNKFTEAISKGDHELARVYVSTTYAILTIIFIFVLFVFYVINPYINWDSILNTQLVPAKELSILVLIVFTFFILRFIIKIIGIILMADQRPAENNALDPLSNILILITIIILLKTTRSSSLIVLGGILSGIPVIVLIAVTIILFKGRYQQYKPSLKYVSLGHTKELMSLGRRFFIMQISFMFLFMSSNIIITQILGPQEVTVYNIAFKYISIPIMIFSIVMSPIWSAVTDAYAKEDILWLKHTLKRLNFISILFVAVIVVMVLISEPVYNLWIEDRVEVPFILSAIMGLYAVINVVLSPFTQYINGFGKLKLSNAIVITQIIIFIPISVFFTKTSLGVAGPMLSSCLINAVGFFFQPTQTYMILNKKAFGIWNK